MYFNNKERCKIDLYNLVTKTKLIHSEQFVPWSNENLQGLYRKIIFSRNSLLGEVSRYYSEDYILWAYQYPDDCLTIQKKWKGKKDTFLSRFIFLHPSLPFFYKRKALWFGLQGYLDIIICTFPLFEKDMNRKEIRDIIPFLTEK